MSNNIKILIADNQVKNLDFLSNILVNRGYKVQTAITGKLAINAAITSPPDLALINVAMPDMDGYEVCQHMKANPITKNIPIIFLNFMYDVSEKVRAFDLGASDYVTKPLQPKEVLVKVNNQLTIRKLQTKLKKQNSRLKNVASELNIRNQQQKSRERYLRGLVEIQRILLGFNDSAECYARIIHILKATSLANCVCIVENYPSVKWCNTDINPEQDNCCETIFSRWQDLLASGNVISSLVADLPAEERFIFQQKGTQAILIVPILVKDDIFEFICFENCSEAITWKTEEVAILEAAASAISLAKKRLQAEIKLQQELNRSKLLKKITDRIRGEFNADSIINTAIQEIGSALNISRGVIFSYNSLRVPAVVARGEYLASGYSSILEEENFLLDNTYLNFLLNQDKAVVAEDIEEEPLVQNNLAKYQEFGIKSMLGIRTSYKGKANGIIYLHQVKIKRCWTTAEVEFLESIAAQLGIAIAQAQLLETESLARLQLQKEVDNRLQIEAALKKSESKYRLLVETSQDIIWSINKNGCILFVNSAVRRVLGYEPNQLINRCFTEFLLPARTAIELSAFERVKNGEPIFAREVTYLNKCGDSVDFLYSSMPLYDTEGNVIKIISTLHDITAIKRVQQALLISAFKLRSNNFVLTNLARNSAIYDGDVPVALKKITEAAAENIEVERASVWLYENNAAVIRCVDLFELSLNSHSEGFSFNYADYPVFFQSLNADEIIATNNPLLDARTQELREIYLEQFNITSLFCVPVRLSGVTTGMLCLEAVQKVHYWTQEDINFGRSLGNLISLALEARLRQAAEAASRLSEQKLAAAFRSSPDPISLSTFPEGRYIEVNDSFCDLFGYTREQVIGLKGIELAIWHSIEQYNSLQELLISKGQIRNHEVDFRIARGDIRTTLLSAELIEINRQQYVLAIARDITQFKQALQETRLLLKATQAISRAIDIDSAFDIVLRLICQHIDWDFGEAWIPTGYGKPAKYYPGWHNNQNNLKEFCRYSETLRFGKKLGIPGIVWKSKKPQWIEDISQVSATKFIRKQIAVKLGIQSCFAVPILNGNEVLAVLMIFKCTTQSRNKRLLELISAVAAQLGGLIKRKQVETAHRRSEERLQLAINASDLGLWDWNINSAQIYRDCRWKEMLGYKDSEVSEDALSLRRLIHPQDINFVRQELKAYLKGKRQTYEVEFRMRSKNHNWKWIQSSGKIFERDTNGLPVRMTGTYKDITERKQAEHILQESERRFRAIFNSSFGFTALLQPNGKIISLNQTALDFFGVTENEVVDKSVWECLGHKICLSRKQLQKLTTKAANGEFIRFEIDFVAESDSISTIDSSIKPIFDDNNRVVLLIAEGRDIQERKILEREIALREARLNAFFKNAPVGLTIVDRQLRFIQINELLAGINGISAKEHLGKTIQEVLPNIASEVEPIYQQVLATNKPILNLEFSGISVSQPETTRNFLVSYFPIPGEDNSPVGVGNVLVEITALKQAETALREREEAFRAIFENAAVGIAKVSPKSQFINVNQQFCQITGYSKSEILQLKCSEITHSSSLAEYLSFCQQLTNNEIDAFAMEKAFVSKNNQLIWTNLTASAIREPSGEIKYIIGVVEDISVRKNAQQQMRLATERLQYLLTSSPAVIFSRLPAENLGKITFVSNNICETFGYTAQEILANSSFWQLHLHPQDLPKLRQYLLQALTQEYASCEYRFLHKDGSYHWLQEKIRLIRNHLGEPLEYVGYWIDISERKQTELNLQLSQRRYQTLAEASPVGIINTDAQGSCIYFNQHWSEITRLSTEESLGEGWMKVLHPKDRQKVLQTWKQALQEKTVFISDHRFLRPDGKTVWVKVQGLPEVDDKGEFKGYIATVTDITDIKLAQTALIESAQREKAIAQIIQRMRQTLDIEEIFAATTDELRSCLNCDRVVVYQFNSESQGSVVGESLAGDWQSLMSLESDSTDFNPLIFEEDGYIIRDLSSNLNQVRDTAADENLEDSYDNGASFICVSDIYQTGFNQYIIDSLEQIQARAYIGVPIFCGNQLWGLLVSYQNSAPRHWKTGEISIAVQIGNHLGVALQQVQLLSQTQHQSQALKQAVIAADAANRAKSEFLTNMSHELRTPLNVILGFSQLMNQDKTISKEHQKTFSIINRAGEHLLQLINDILEMSKIEAGRSSLNIDDFDLYKLLDNLQEMLRFRAASKNLQLTFKTAANLPRYIQGDESKLRQVLINLIGNAIKFTNQGYIQLSVSVDEKEKSSTHIIFELTDTGVGISEEETEFLFEAFKQTSAGRQSQQGTGLGLAISRKYVQLMQGDIKVESTLGVGSKFTFDIQVNLSSPQKIETNKITAQIIGLAPSQIKYRILVVDDRPESRLLLVKMLSQLGFSTKEAANGVQAIAEWEEWEPHLILMDMRMPTMDGYQATKIIKTRQQEAEYDGNIPSETVVIALTANAFEEQKDEIIAAGCDDLINKPFPKETLLEKLNQHLGVEYSYQQETDNTSSTEFTSATLRQSLAQESPEWLNEIKQAAAQCSDNLIFEILETVPPKNPQATQILKYFADNFQFDKITEAID
ncbi:MAG: PAS domain S-box protein [Rivularia sp. (in: Bacteria)]|nr:PAS domain S-box protein [Rivularia sp. MS3]